MLARNENLFLQDIESAVRRCADAQVSRFPTGLAVRASGANGFDMSIMVEDGRYALYFDNWTEEFDCEDIARETFEAALTGEARLRVDMLSGRRWRWTLERLDDNGRWQPESTIGHVTWRFWGQPSTLYLRNTFRQVLGQARPDDASPRAADEGRADIQQSEF
jgi:hypothetical protein